MGFVKLPDIVKQSTSIRQVIAALGLNQLEVIIVKSESYKRT